MDSKSRVSIPPLWRPGPGAAIFLVLSKTHELPVVKVFGAAYFQEQAKRIRDSDRTHQEKSNLLRYLAMMSREAVPDPRGRLVIPSDMRNTISIVAGGETILAGCGSHFEIWSKENFETMRTLEIAVADEFGIF